MSTKKGMNKLRIEHPSSSNTVLYEDVYCTVLLLHPFVLLYSLVIEYCMPSYPNVPHTSHLTPHTKKRSHPEVTITTCMYTCIPYIYSYCTRYWLVGTTVT